MLKPRRREATLQALSLALSRILLDTMRKPKVYAAEDESGCYMAAEEQAGYGNQTENK